MARLIPPSVRRSEITLWARLAELDGDFVVRRMEAGEHGEVVVNIERRNRSLRLVPVALSGETRAADIGPLAETLARTLPTRISAASDGANTFSLATPTATLVLVSGASRPLVTELESLLHERLGFDVCAEPELLVRVVSLLADEPEHASGSSQAPKAQLYALPGASSGRRATPKPRDQAARFAQIDLEPEQVEAASVDLGTFLPAEQAATARQFRVRLVTGVAGSGKTLIAKYRARLLAAAFPHDTVLFLCNNTPLAATIRAELAREVPSARVQVKTFSSWAWQHHRRACNRHPLAKLSERKAIVQDLRRDVGVPDRITTKELVEEIDFITDHLIETLPEYQHVKRVGRGFGLSKDERASVWQLHLAHREQLVRCDMVTHSEVVRALCQHPDAARRMRVQHILIDEAQFFSKARFELLKRAIAPGGHLFMCADPDQGFLGYGASWRSLGIVLGKRTKKLRHSYRTTRAILAAAQGVLPELNAGDEHEDRAKPDYTRMRDGKEPSMIRAASRQDAIDRLIDKLGAFVREGKRIGDVLVIYGEQVSGEQLNLPLVRRFGAPRVWWMNDRAQKYAPPSASGAPPLRLVSLRTATGLEAKIVFVIGIDALLNSTKDPREERSAPEGNFDGRLLYMAMTRAAQTLVLVTTAEPPAHLSRWFVIEGPQ